MEEKKISEKESLKLIMTMIDQTKTDDGRHSGDTMLIWGYLTTLLGLVIYGLTLATNTPQWNLLWLSLPFVGFLSSYLFSRRKTDEDVCALNDQSAVDGHRDGFYAHDDYLPHLGQQFGQHTTACLAILLGRSQRKRTY